MDNYYCKVLYIVPLHLVKFLCQRALCNEQVLSGLCLQSKQAARWEGVTLQKHVH